MSSFSHPPPLLLIPPFPCDNIPDSWLCLLCKVFRAESRPCASRSFRSISVPTSRRNFSRNSVQPNSHLVWHPWAFSMAEASPLFDREHPFPQRSSQRSAHPPPTYIHTSAPLGCFPLVPRRDDYLLTLPNACFRYNKSRHPKKSFFFSLSRLVAYIQYHHLPGPPHRAFVSILHNTACLQAVCRYRFSLPFLP